MNLEKQPQLTEEELQASLKEDYIRSSGAMLIGETVAGYRKRKEEEWDRMHPEKKEKVENEADNSETVQGNKEDDEQWKGRTEASEAKRQEDLKKVRQELGLETAPVERLTGTLGKVQEYDERIRAVRAGKPIKTTDKEDSLLASFKSFVKQDWSEDFDMNRFQKEREARKRIDEIKPIDITQINENSGIERGKFDSKQISFKQEGEFVKRFYAGQPWGSFEGNLIEQVIQGKKIRVIVMNKASDAHASFEPFSDTYTIGTKAREEFEKDPEMFLASMNHEVSHDEFFSLNEETQRKVGDLFLQDPRLKDILKKFATTIYTDKFIFNEKETGGQHYLMVHDVNNKATNETTLSLEGQKGLKDVRSIVFEISGEKKEVFVGLLITELISYMSSLEMSDEIFNKVAEAGREKRGGEDPRYDVMKICHEYIKNDPQLYEEFKKLKLLGGNKDAEDFFTGLLDNKKDEVEHVTGKEKSGEEKLLEKFDELAKKRIERIENDGTRKIIVQGMKDLFQKMRQDGSKKEIMDYLLSETYNQKRRVEYPDNPDYEKAWELAVGDNSLKHKIENNWVYRGNFTSAEKKTVNRGSLNITITEDFVRDLDSLIKDGVIDANYKFGEPGIQTEAGGRHDAVNIYFLTEPSSEAIKALSGIADKYYRGDNLLGKQISKGFSMSEFGSVSDTHAKELVRMIEEIDPEAGKSVRGFLTNKERIAMSEAQFYSTKETLNLLGIDMEYSSEKGFQVKKI